MRIVIAMMKHETNTFSPIVTDWARFEAWGAYTRRRRYRARTAATRMPVAAYMALARERGAEFVTPLAAEAMPSGPVREDAYERMAGLICDAVDGRLRRGASRSARRDGEPSTCSTGKASCCDGYATSPPASPSRSPVTSTAT